MSFCIIYFRITKAQINMMQRDITKWLSQSSKLKITSAIQYGKIKSAMAVFESKASPEEAAALCSELGNLTLSGVFVLRIFSEAIVTRINKNATANIESLMEDLEDLEVSVTNRKRKRGKTNTPAKKIKTARRRLFKETPSAKQFLQDETQISGSYK